MWLTKRPKAFDKHWYKTQTNYVAECRSFVEPIPIDSLVERKGTTEWRRKEIGEPRALSLSVSPCLSLSLSRCLCVSLPLRLSLSPSLAVSDVFEALYTVLMLHESQVGGWGGAS